MRKKQCWEGNGKPRRITLAKKLLQQRQQFVKRMVSHKKTSTVVILGPEIEDPCKLQKKKLQKIKIKNIAKSKTVNGCVRL